MFVDFNNDDYHLLSSSPAIDAGETTLSSFDFEGNPTPYLFTNTDIGIYEFQSALGLSDIENEVIIYPNPVQNQLTISLNKNIESITCSVIDIRGTVILNYELNNIQIYEMDLSNIANGVYFLHILNQNKKKVIKILKQ